MKTHSRMGSAGGGRSILDGNQKTFDMNKHHSREAANRSPFQENMGNGLMQGQQLYDFQMKAMES